MYSNILVPLALDHGVGHKAIDVARQLLAPGGKIMVLHVFEVPAGTVGAFVDAQVMEAGFEKAKEDLHQKLEGQSDVTGSVVRGHSGRTIIDVATAEKVDCIVMGSHKPGLSDFLLGATAARVVRHAPCAVHVMRGTV